MAQRRTKKKDISDTINIVKVIKVNPRVLSFIFFAFAISIFLAIISYNRLDLTGWSDLQSYLKGVRVNNLLGLVGANIAKAFFEFTLGYPAVVFPIWLAYVGVRLFMNKKENVFFHRKFLLIVQIAIFSSVILAMPESIKTAGRIIDYFPSGLIGGIIAELLVRFLSSYGAVIMLIVYGLALLFVYIPNLLDLIKLPSLPKFRLPKIKIDRSESDDDTDIIIDGTINEDELNEKNTELVKFDEKENTFISISEGENQNKELEEGQDIESFSKKIDIIEDTMTGSDPIEELKNIENSEDSEDSKEYEKIDEEVESINEKPSVKNIKKTSNGKKEVELSNKEKENIEKLLVDATGISEDNNQNSNDDEIANELDDIVEKNFTIEDEIEEKQGNLDKSHKKLSKRERYNFPSISLLVDPPADEYEIPEEELWMSAKMLEDKLMDFKVEAKVVNVVAGPVITMFELRPAVGVRVGKIESLMQDIALKLSAKGIRYLGQLPSKDTIGIEIPNSKPKTVYFKQIINSEKFIKSKDELPISLGKAINGEIIIRDLTKMPHLLVAGATGAGKSVGLNAIITSLLYCKHPDDLKFVMIDPKMLELGLYNKLENHHLAYSSQLDEKVVTNPDNAVAILRAVVLEMEVRYKHLASVSVRNIKEYNDKVAGKPVDKDDKDAGVQPKLPYIVVIIDELADLMITAGKEIEEPIARLTQMARAVGIHCVIATQRPSVNVITGVIKANIPTRIAFQTATKIDSRTILDSMGAEQLLGRGDMLFLPPGQAKPIRIQNAFLDTEEIEDVLNHIKTQEFSLRLDLELMKDEKSSTSPKSGGNSGGQKDVLYEDAKRVVVENQTGSISFLQRRLAIGYSRAAKIVDQLEDEGVVGPYNGSNAREVYLAIEDLD